MFSLTWSPIWQGFIADLAILLVSVIISGIIGFFKGRKVSCDAVSRKKQIYQPLIDELNPISSGSLDVLSNIQINFTKEIIYNNYKYSIDSKLLEKMKCLSKKVEKYEEISLINVAKDVLVSQFINGYKDLYGSVIAGTSYSEDQEGTKYEIEHEVQELDNLKRVNCNEDIKSLLNYEGMPSLAFRMKNNNVDYIYEEVFHIYDKAFLNNINGKTTTNRKMLKEWDGRPSEYIAYNYDFFDSFNKAPKTIEKYQLREEIIELSQKIIEELEGIVEKIVCKYEKENI